MAGIYIHIPFCKQACNYCNFHFSTNMALQSQIVLAITKELQLKKQYLNTPVKTIYFGGGTPSILSLQSIELLLQAVSENFVIDSNAEITLEANPDDVHEQNITGWKALGINRLSMGVQSFNDKELQWMNRSHNSIQALQSLNLVATHFDNFSVDLIYGSHLLTHKQWMQNIEQALNFKPPHLSCYALTVEEKTVLNKQINNNKNIEPQPEHQSQQFEILIQQLQANNYEHYEISNFALPGFRSKHNSSYWQGKHYVGIGPAAHSFNGSTRSWNMANNALYIKSIENNLPFAETETLTITQQLNEYLMIALRTIEGISEQYINKQFGDIYSKGLHKKTTKWITDQKVEYSNQHWALTPKGKFFADGIAGDLFW